MVMIAETGSNKSAFAGDTRAQSVISDCQQMERDAINFMTRWQECANYISPRKGNILTILSPGSPQTILIWDTTAENALMVYAAGLVSFLTPPTERWFRLEPKSQEASQDLKDWFDDVSEKMADEIAASNFYEVWHEDCNDGGCFGSSLMRCDEYPDDEELLNFVNIPVGTFWWREDNKGKVSVICRKWKWTAEQCAQEFGEENLTEAVHKAYMSNDGSSSNRCFEIIERVSPRDKRDVRQGKTFAQFRPFESLYVVVEDNAVIREEGYYENPYAGCRTMRSNNEEYGRGPGDQAMPTIKMVNRIKEDISVVIEKMARPSWTSPDDTAYDPDNRPDGVTYWDASKGVHYKPEQIEMKNRPDLADKLLEEEREMIREYFYNSMFKLLTSNDEMQREKTAYEVSQMVAERMILFSPIFGRITKEKLNPMLYRVFAIMLRNKRFKPIPIGLDENTDFKVTYISKIALAIKAIQNQSLATALQIIQSMVQVDPTVVYILKAEQACRDVFGNSGVPQRWMRSTSEVKTLAKQQQDQQARLQAAQAGLAASQTVKNLGPQAQAGATKAVSAAAPMKAAGK